MFEFDFSDELKRKMYKLEKRAPKIAKAINKKVKQIINNDLETINRYKNLRYDLKANKRVHVSRSFVLTFKICIEKNFILFEDFDHHDKIYKK